MGYRHISEKTKSDIVDALSKGMTREEVAKLLGIHASTVYRTLKDTKEKIILFPPNDKVVTHVSSLDMFISNLEALIPDYKRMKAERENFRRSAEQWQIRAGKINAELATMATRITK